MISKNTGMKRIITIFICLTLITLLASTGSCKKDNKIRGCMDKDSKNYSSTAQEDDGSCLYEGEIVFWYSQAASAGLVADGATALTFYLNSQIIGSSAASVYWVTAPLCGDNGSITATEDLGKDKTHSYTLSVQDQTGHEYWGGTVHVDANTCTQNQLLWSSRKKK
jgi:hypothetical protein